ncbi:MAG: hypothetical protein JWO13_3049 [Acidobacteriales bacterium]|nr:hypothetical protein [Terriglobales bacterium]
MPLARIITSTPSAAKDLAQTLSDSGYIVDIVSPYRIPASAVDLEINLDMENGIASAAETSAPNRNGEQAFAASDYAESDLSEIPEDYVAEREFVLAPAWRKLTGHLRETWSNFRPQRSTEPTPVAEIPADSGYAILRARNLEARKRVSKQFSKAQGSASHSAQRAQALIRKHAARINDAATAHAMRAKAQIALLTSEFAARVQQRRAKNPSLVSQEAGSSRERFVIRQLWPVAVGVALAFIVGFVAASYTKVPVPAEQAATASNGVTVVANPMHAAKLRKPKATKAVLPRQSAATARRAVYDPDAEDEVIVRHYPSKQITAKNQNPGPKRFSDLQ